MACKAIVQGSVKYSLFGITQIFNHLCQAAELHIFLNRFIYQPLEQTLKIERGQAGNICQFLRINFFCYVPR